MQGNVTLEMAIYPSKPTETPHRRTPLLQNGPAFTGCHGMPRQGDKHGASACSHHLCNTQVTWVHTLPAWPEAASLLRRNAQHWCGHALQARHVAHLQLTYWLTGEREKKCFTLTENSQAQKSLAV